MTESDAFMSANIENHHTSQPALSAAQNAHGALPAAPSPVDQARIAAATAEMLAAIGEDVQRAGLRATPRRVGQAWAELTAGYHVDPVRLINDAIFEVDHDDMVIVRDIGFYSLCEHHLLPFVGRAHVAYIPQGKIVGLSKIPRIVEMYARRLQVQERMTRQIADFLASVLAPHGVAVVLEGVHLCAMIRGVKKHEASMTTSCMLGTFRESPDARREFQSLLGLPGASQLIG